MPSQKNEIQPFDRFKSQQKSLGAPSLLSELSSFLEGSPLGTAIETISKVIGSVSNEPEDNKEGTVQKCPNSVVSVSPIKSFSVKKDSFLKTLAILAADAYGKREYRLPYGCYLCQEYKTDSGLHAKVYRLINGQYVCAFAGTNSWRDALEDIIQCLGMSPQFEDALKFGRSLIRKYPNVVFTGHSQGGGEAAYCAYVLGKTACTFNPAGLSQFTSWKIPQKNIQNADVHSYIFGMDVLHVFQTSLSAKYPLLNIGPDGNVHHVTDYEPERFSISHFHGMEGILCYFEVRS